MNAFITTAADAWVAQAIEAAEFFNERKAELTNWECSCEFYPNLFQFFPKGTAIDNRENAKRAARAIGGTWVRRRDANGEGWETDIALPSCRKVRVILHHVLRSSSYPADVVLIGEGSEP